MTKCQFYKEDRKFIPSQENNGSQQQDGNLQIKPYCTHHQSPAPKENLNTIGATWRLTCGGDLAKCQIPNGPI